MIEARSRTESDSSGTASGTSAQGVQPAFVLSCERSGSTLLRWLLDAHSEVVSPGELRLGRLAYDLYLTLSRTATINVPEEERVEKTLRAMRRVIDGILEPYVLSRDKRIWCEKTPENLSYLDPLANAYPDARYLCLYRNCRDVVRSCLAVSREGFMVELADYAGRRPGNLVEAMAESWIDKTGALLRFEMRNPFISHPVRYEDLVADPASSLRPVFEFLGVEWENEVVQRAFEMEHDGGGGDSRIHETHGVEPRKNGLAEVSFERLSPLTRARVNTLSEKLGYDEV